jgi:hypothetical protein
MLEDTQRGFAETMRTTSKFTQRTGLAMAMGLLVAGCSDSTAPDAFADEIDYDMAIVAADATLEDVAMWSQPFDFAHAVPAPGRPGGRDGWAGELSGTRAVTFSDIDGVEQTAYDALTTDLIHIVHEIEGEVTRDGWTVTVHRERDKTVSGLAGTETHRTWNGTGSEEITRTGFTLEGSERSYEAVGTFAYEDVVVPIPGSTPPYPISGTITRHLTVTVMGPAGTRTRDVDVVIEFDGTSNATATVNGETRVIDLTTADGRLPLRRR